MQQQLLRTCFTEHFMIEQLAFGMQEQYVNTTYLISFLVRWYAQDDMILPWTSRAGLSGIIANRGNRTRYIPNDVS